MVMVDGSPAAPKLRSTSVAYCINTFISDPPGVLYIFITTPVVRLEKLLQFDPSTTWDLRRRTGIIPIKDPHTRIKPLTLASGHGRYIAVTPKRTPVSVGE